MEERYKEIETRLAAIKTELDTADMETMEKLEEEIRTLQEERAALNAEAEKRAALLIDVEKNSKTITSFEEEKKMDAVETRNKPEYIEAYANYIKTGSDKECRALLTTNASGVVPVPDFVETIVKTAWEREALMQRVRRTSLPGNVKVGFEISATDAVIHTEGTAAPSEETLVLGIVNLVPQSIKKWITISDEALDMGGEAFLMYVYDELTYKIAKKCADTLIGKIITLGTTATADAVSAQQITSDPGIGVIAQAIAQLSDDAANPIVVMNKATWGAFKAEQYTANYAQDVFEGLDVVFNNSLPAITAATTGDVYAIVGDFGYGAQANFPGGEGITIKYDDLSLAEQDLVKLVGREYVALDAVAPNAFTLIKAE